VWIRNHLANPVVRAVARSPAHRLLGRRLVLLSYRGRRTGRRRELPVMTAADGKGLIVVVGQPDAKTWWRNFGSAPTDVVVRTGGKDQHRSARRLLPGDPGYAGALTHYRQVFRRAVVADASPVIVFGPPGAG
jgi:hypothetical protein